MRYSVNIGRIHPDFFDCSYIFKRLTVEISNEGGILIYSPRLDITLLYNYLDGILECSDRDVLADFSELILEQYGTNVTRESFKSKIDWGSMPNDYNILNVGVCDLKDKSGWDGGINSIWFDAKAPGKVIDIYFQYWNRRLLLDAWKFDATDVKNLGGREVVLPNLLESYSYIDSKYRSKLDSLIKTIL